MSKHTTPGLPLLDEAGAAARLNMTRRALQEWRRRGYGPVFVRISGRCVRYRPEDLDEWVETRIRTSTSDRGPDRAA